jgi:hypothetical protein
VGQFAKLISAPPKQERFMANITPKYFYDWLMAIKATGTLKCGPLEAFKEERFNHAISRKAGAGANLSFGMWDHRTNTGWLDPDRAQPKEDIKPAPAIPDGDKEWDL